jgi:hypothetical protein
MSTLPAPPTAGPAVRARRIAIAALAVIVLAVVAVTPSADLGGGSDTHIPHIGKAAS